jgi:UDP-glucose 4-epimerase
MKVLVTGAAGFIGSHLSESIQLRGDRVWCLDSLDASYSTQRKRTNLEEVLRHGDAEFVEADICEAARLTETFLRVRPDVVVHLAARPGVRASVESPGLYSGVNIGGTINVLEAARIAEVRKVVFASSSSVYGASNRVPFCEADPLPRPESPYAATKAAAEDMCHLYHSLHGLSVQCVRLFTVYGPRQRPDLAVSKFTTSIIAGQPVPLYGDGSAARDYTHVSDTVRGILAAVDHAGSGDVFNVGSGGSYSINELVERLGGPVTYIPKRPGEPDCTYADTTRIRDRLGWAPKVSFAAGVGKMLEHIELWRAAPVWTPDAIAKETADWFRYLGRESR